jgi:hypothetical protein
MSLINENITSEGILSGNTLYAEIAEITNLVVTNITGASTTDYYVTGGTYSSGTLTLERNGLSDVTITGFADGTLTGSGITSKVAFWSDETGLSANTNFHWDNANERLGIGFSSPTAKVHINNTGATDSFLVEDSVNPDTSPFVISNSGNVGIGLTTPLYPLHISAAAVASTNEPIVRVQVSDSNAYLAINNAVTADSVFVPEVLGRGDSTNSLTAIVMGAYIDPTQDVGTSPVTVFRSGLASIANVTTRPLFDFRNLLTSVMLIDANGDLGIGTSNPTSRLTVVTTGSTTGSYPATSGTIQTGDIVRLRNGGSNLVLDIGGFSSNGNWFQSTNQTNLSLTFPLLLNPNGGKVGINLTTPTESLHVSGNTITTGSISGASLNVTTLPTLNNANSDFLTRNSATGEIERSTPGNAVFYAYGLGFAQSIGNYLT